MWLQENMSEMARKPHVWKFFIAEQNPHYHVCIPSLTSLWIIGHVSKDGNHLILIPENNKKKLHYKMHVVKRREKKNITEM